MKVPWALRNIPSVAWKAWFTPPPLGSRTALRDAEAVAGMDEVDVAGVTGLAVGSGPMVIALHGWGGRSAQMAPLAHRLAGQGYRVLAIDLPGGAGGEPTDLKKIAVTLRAIFDGVGPVEAVVAHSMANMVLRLVPPPTDRVVLAAPLLRVSHAVDSFTEQLSLRPWVRSGLLRRLPRWDPQLWSVIDGTHPEQFDGADVLIVHDPEDSETPYRASVDLAERNSSIQLVPLMGVGHGGILSDESAIETIAEFIAGRGTARQVS